MKKITKPLTSFIVSNFLLLLSFNGISQVAPVTIPSGGFNINGQVKVSSTVGDWTAGTAAGATGGYVLEQSTTSPFPWQGVNTSTTKIIRDSFDNAADLIFTGSSFGDNPNTWKWTTGKATSKCDINNALFHSATSSTQKWLILGGDRLSTTGTSYIDFQFSQGIFTRTATGFSSVGPNGESLTQYGGRTAGDFVLSMEYTNGGAVATVHYYRWQETGEGTGTFKFVDLGVPAGAFGASNSAAIDVPYRAFGSNSYIAFAFVEAAVNIDAILSGQCQSVNIRSIFVSTKASDSYSAALKDFVEPQEVNFTFGQAGLSYPQTSYCASATATPSVPASPNGTFTSSPSLGANLNSTTGVITLTGVTPGTYTITYTPDASSGACLTPSNFQITVTALPAITPGTNPTVCRGATSASLPYTGATAGFTDVVDANLPASPISIVVPAAAAAATYNGVLTVRTAAGCVSANYNITVTVNALPSNLTAGIDQPTCSTPTGTITVTSGTTGLSFSINSTTPANFTNTNGIFSGLAAGTYTIRSKNANGCISNGLEKVVSAAATNPPAGDVVIVSNVSCVSSTGTLRVVVAATQADYNNTDFEIAVTGTDVWYSPTNHVFPFAAGQGYHFTVRRKADHSCTVTINCNGQDEEARSNNTGNTNNINTESGRVTTTNINIDSPTMVKAYPNPFSDKVRFVVSVPVEGDGALDLYNMMGQRIKNIYTGHFKAGTQNFELSLPGNQVATLVYVLRVSGKQVTGKLVQVN
jgi:hypothetical protein